jgi:tripartite-type tricarboxylate transporter receptor subunit TctC
MNRIFAAFLCALASLAAVPASAQQDYPNKAARIIVSFPPGSTPDIAARTIAPALHQLLGQPFVVDNRSGAAGNIGGDTVAKAAPDGYTLLVSTNGPVAINQLLYSEMPYDPMKDLAPVSLLVRAPQVLVIGRDVPASDFKGFVEYARKHPAKMSYGSVGNGSASHLTMEDLKLKAQIDLVHVPYRGFPGAVTDLVGGQIQTMFAIASGVLPQIESGNMKGIAITSEKRWPAAPTIPTLGELGYPNSESYAWIGLLAPAKTPPDIIARLHAATVKALGMSEQHTALEKQGFEVVGSTPEAFETYRQAEAARWGEVIRRTGAKAE